jgi:mono/diheme cytochrome c family protein
MPSVRVRAVIPVVLCTAILTAGGIAIVTLAGRVTIRGDVEPPSWEASLAGMVLDASIAHQAPKVADPTLITDDNLIAGMKSYRANCAGCHGQADGKTGAFSRAYYPPVPQFTVQPPRLTEAQLFYVAKHGIRYTGMPAWATQMTDEDLWKTVAFVARIGRLPPLVNQAFHRTDAELFPTDANR